MKCISYYSCLKYIMRESHDDFNTNAIDTNRRAYRHTCSTYLRNIGSTYFDVAWNIIDKSVTNNTIVFL